MARHSRRRLTEGFTLIEILVVVGIIALLAGMTIVGARAIRQRSARHFTETVIKQLELAFERCKQDTGDYPDTTGPDGQNGFPGVYPGLASLKLADAFGGKGKEKGATALVTVSGNTYVCDYWRKPIQFDVSDTAHSSPGPDIWSMGPDGANNSGGGDDIANWNLR